MTARIGRTILALSGCFALAMLPSTARAQGNTFNPYGNSGYADYREFGNPNFPTNPALPGQARLNSEPTVTRPRANSYQQYTESLNAPETDPGSVRRASSSLPYYQAYQQLNSQYGRVYRPNDTPGDRQFEERLKQRDAAYAKALEERNPVKRMKLLREIEQRSVDRTARTPAPRSTATPAARGSNPSGTSTRAPSPYATTAPPLPGERRTPPPPYSSGVERRPSTTTLAPRMPARTPANSATNPTTASPTTSTATPAPRTDSTIQPVPDPSTVIPPPR